MDWESKIPKPKPGFSHRKAGGESVSLPPDLPFRGVPPLPVALARENKVKVLFLFDPFYREKVPFCNIYFMSVLCMVILNCL